MKNKFLMPGLVALLTFTSCSKQLDAIHDKISQPGIETDTTNTGSVKSYILYTIPQGHQYCDKNAYAAVQYAELSFKVKFDSSAIYTTQAASNQKDVNKLYGFSDNNAAHHDYSARFGWRWSDNALRLFAYTYNKGTLSIKELGTVALGIENDCSIKVQGENYVFILNGVTVNMARAATTPTAQGYQLYPYFGGDETAPHDVRIWIK